MFAEKVLSTWKIAGFTVHIYLEDANKEQIEKPDYINQIERGETYNFYLFIYILY